MTKPDSNETAPNSPVAGVPDETGSFWDRWGLEAIVLAAVLVRAIAAFARPETLAADPDGYVRLAESVATGHGLVDETGQPTAYRPPLYPLLLAGPVRLLGHSTGVLAANLVASAVLVWLTYLLGRGLFGPAAARLAAAVVAFDPLLVLYTLQPMTEVPFALLTTLLLVLLLHVRRREDVGESSTTTWLLAGLVFGLAALCRPTVWAWLVVLTLPWLLRAALQRLRCPSSPTKPGLSRTMTGWACFGVATAVVVLPWVVRNTMVLGRPVLMTTHGGYTLLLANNPVFYDEVVRQPWGTVWSGESLGTWQDSLDEAMAAEEPPVVGELSRDRWMRRRALGNVADEPTTFLRSCYVRVLRFWNPAPLVASVPRSVFWGVTFYAAVVFGLAIGGLGTTSSREQPRLWPAVALVVALTAVHAVYWSNARMRAPLTPVVAVLAACGATRFFSARSAP